MMRSGHLIYQGLADPIQPGEVETITIDKWFQPRENPILRKSLQVAILAGSLFFVDSVSNSSVAQGVPTWHPAQNQPARLVEKLPRQFTPETRVEVVVAAEVITMDKWFQPIQQPRPARGETRQTGGETRFELPRTILVTDWFQPIRSPHFSKRRDYFTGEFKFELPRTVLVTDWFSQLQLPFRSKFILQQGGETRTDIFQAPEIVTLDKWFQPVQQPLNKKRLFLNGSVVGTLTIEVAPVVTEGEIIRGNSKFLVTLEGDSLIAGTVIGNSKFLVTLTDESLITSILSGKSTIRDLLNENSKIL